MIYFEFMLLMLSYQLINPLILYDLVVFPEAGFAGYPDMLNLNSGRVSDTKVGLISVPLPW